MSFCTISHLLNLEHRVFGCIVYVHIPKELRGKLDLYTKRCVFVGYSNIQKGINVMILRVRSCILHFMSPFMRMNLIMKEISGSNLYEENVSEALELNK